ncbi:transglycosylase SLT domain-containing protein, partial [Mycobacterium avium]|uniref:transglycosylase SLT domain-containing protein n=2 Tax=Mycobacterium avium TaxID=1764 RepID=UPI000A051CB3
IRDSPHPDWTGNAAGTAANASAALHQARTHLYSTAQNSADITATAARISTEAHQQLDAILADWNHTKAAAAATPGPLRDSALLASGQQRITEAMNLIFATAARYDQAANSMRALTTDLAEHLDEPHNGHDPTADPAAATPPNPSGQPVTSASAPAAGTAPTTTAGIDPSALAPAAGALMPAAMTPLAAPAALMPMAGALPAAATTPLGAMGSLTGLTGYAGHPGTGLVDTSLPDQPGSAGDIRATRVYPKGSVDAAIDAALDALGITDPAARERWHTGYQTLIHRESGNNANAVNLIDRNARGPKEPDGAPAGSSRGLTQLTPDNFRKYRLPTLSNNIYDPVANIAASIRYVMDVHKVQPSAIDLATKVQQANPHAPAAAY